MGVLGEIIYKLGWDPTFWWQLAILLVMFFILKFLLFDKLIAVLEERENQTTKLFAEADGLRHRTEEIEKQFQGRLDEARNDIKKLNGAKHEELMSIERVEIQKLSKELDEIYDKKQIEINGKHEEARKEALRHADELSEALVEKLVK